LNVTKKLVEVKINHTLTMSDRHVLTLPLPSFKFIKV